MNDRSDAALRERLELAKKATPEGENTLWMVDGAVRGDLCIREGFNFKRLLTMGDCTNRATARHIAASSPDVVRADLEEILALRGRVRWLSKCAFKDTNRCAKLPGFSRCVWNCGEWCGAADDLRKGCWRDAADVAALDVPGISGEVRENEGEDKR